MTDLKPCPFCGAKLIFTQSVWIDKSGNLREDRYWLHDDVACVLNEANVLFSIGAGDARPEYDYPGENALKWNKRYNEKEV